MSRSNLGPFTSAFTYPASCTTNHIACDGCTYGWQAQLCSATPDAASFNIDDPGCWPPRTSGAPPPAGGLHGWGFYSPAFSCPVGYTTACAATATVTSGSFSFQFPPLGVETAIGCCPTLVFVFPVSLSLFSLLTPTSGYGCAFGGGDSGQTCQLRLTTGTFTAMQCAVGGTSLATHVYTVGSDGSAITATVTTANKVTTSTQIYTLPTFALFAPMIQLVHVASSTATDTASATGGTSSGRADSSGGGLSPGAGIGVGIAIGILLGVISALAWWFVHRVKAARQRRALSLGEVPKNHVPERQIELPAGEQHELA